LESATQDVEAARSLEHQTTLDLADKFYIRHTLTTEFEWPDPKIMDFSRLRIGYDEELNFDDEAELPEDFSWSKDLREIV
jgi:hypothetical protein